MNDKEPVIRVNNISKKYVIGHKKATNTMRDNIADKVTSIFRNKEDSDNTEDFWALKDVSFDVYKGETLGIIGGNGAGKSTLLKILSRIVEPTEGGFTANGRVASLLEVGTGFHPELTGRENVFFNGSVLGMTRKEIIARFDEIVAFSEVERFIDTPVKFYSSGMYVRLAFAIAAHLDPEILIVDEALAVGDVNFQQKCIEKMRNAARSGKTVIFVSHAMAMVEDLCDRAIYLKNGEVQTVGDTAEVISAYLGTTVGSLKPFWDASMATEPTNDNPVIPLSLKLLDEKGKQLAAHAVAGEPILVDLEIDVPKPTQDLSVGISIMNEQNVRLFRTAITDPKETGDRINLVPGHNHFQVLLPTADIIDGSYIISLDCDVYKKAWVHNPYFTEARTKIYIKNDGSLPQSIWEPEREGVTKPFLKWHKK